MCDNVARKTELYARLSGWIECDHTRVRHPICDGMADHPDIGGVLPDRLREVLIAILVERHSDAIGTTRGDRHLGCCGSPTVLSNIFKRGRPSDGFCVVVIFAKQCLDQCPRPGETSKIGTADQI